MQLRCHLEAELVEGAPPNGTTLGWVHARRGPSLKANIISKLRYFRENFSSIGEPNETYLIDIVPFIVMYSNV